jgi:iron complex outermembrane receptor protein
MSRSVPLRLAALLATLAAPLAAQSSATVRGTVTDAQRGQPIDNALVGVLTRPERTTSDESGRFSLRLPAGSHTLVITALGMRPDTQQVTLAADAIVSLDIALERAAARLASTLVTAQKRTQELQEVPISISAYDGDFLTRASVQEFDALAYIVPNLNLQLQSPNNPSFSIRGITSDDGSAQIEPRVSVFADGVPMSKSRGSVVELFDMERVEVLKGPQGTLFSRGAQIGAIHLIQNKPTRERSAALRLGTGNFGETYALAVLNAPLVGEQLLGRLAIIDNRRDGFIPNVSGGTLLGKATTAVRGSLRWFPSDRTTVDLIANFQNDQPPGTSFKSGSFAPANGDTRPFSAADLEAGEELGIDRRVYSGTLIVNHALGSAWQLRNITAARGFTSDEAFDADGTRAPALRLNEIANGRQYSSEFRLEFDNGGRFAGFGGVSLFNESGSQRVPFSPDERSLWALIYPLVLGSFPANLQAQVRPLFPAGFVVNGEPVLPARLPTIPGTPFQGQTLNPNHFEVTENFGQLTAADLFVDGTFRVTDRVSLSAGLRGTREWVDNALETPQAATPGTLGAFLGGGTNNLFRPTGGRQRGTGQFNSWVGRAVLSVTPAENVNTYLSVSRGRRPNIVQIVYNATARAFEPSTLKEEAVISTEGGVKTTLLDGRLGADLALFRYSYRNFRTQILDPNQGNQGQQLFITRDDGFSTAQGLEASTRAQFTRALSAFATYGYLDATFDEQDVNGNPQRLAGNRFRLAPRHNYSVGASFDRSFANRAGVSITPTWLWRGQHFFEEANQPAIQQEAYGLLNLRATVTLPGGRFQVIGIARNVLNREYIIDAGNTGGAFGIPTFISGAPRFISLQVGYGF